MNKWQLFGIELVGACAIVGLTIGIDVKLHTMSSNTLPAVAYAAPCLVDDIIVSEADGRLKCVPPMCKTDETLVQTLNKGAVCAKTRFLRPPDY